MNLEDKIKSVCSQLLSGDVAILPTDTLYGLAANAYDEQAVDRVFAIKERPFDKQLPIHYHSLEHMEADVVINETLIKLANKFLPGPLTLVVLKKPESKLAYVGESIAVRTPNNKILLEILRTINKPLTMPSANKNGHIPKATFQEISQELLLNGIADDANVTQVASTIIDITGQKPICLRQGVITMDQINQALT